MEALPPFYFLLTKELIYTIIFNVRKAMNKKVVNIESFSELRIGESLTLVDINEDHLGAAWWK